MQLPLSGMRTELLDASTTALYIWSGRRLLAHGAQEVGALVEIEPGYHANTRAQLAVRYYSTNDSQSAGSAIDLDTSQAGPGKSFKKGSVTSGSGIFIEYGVKLFTSADTHPVRARIRYPTLLTT